MVIQYELKAKS